LPRHDSAGDLKTNFIGSAGLSCLFSTRKQDITPLQDVKRKHPFSTTTFFMRFVFVNRFNPSRFLHCRTASTVVIPGQSLPDDKNSVTASSVKMQSGGKFESAQAGQ
jgi:hypothetical protein